MVNTAMGDVPLSTACYSTDDTLSSSFAAGVGYEIANLANVIVLQCSCTNDLLPCSWWS